MRRELSFSIHLALLLLLAPLIAKAHVLPNQAASSAGQPEIPAEWQQPWTTQDIIDARIDVSAQYALMRMCSGSPDEIRDMSGILSAVKSGSLAGIYIQDQQVPALRARDHLGIGWWQLLPSGVNASCIIEPTSLPPILVLRKGAGQDRHQFDADLRDAWMACGLPPSEPRACRQTLPPKQPKEARSCAQAAGHPTLTVRVLSKSGPVAGAQVIVSGGDADEIQGETTDGPGVVHFTLNGPGLYAIRASQSNYESLSGTAVQVAGACSYSRTVVLGEAPIPPPNPCPNERFLMLKAQCEENTRRILGACVRSYASQIQLICKEALPCLANFALDPTGGSVITCILQKIYDGTCALAGAPSVLLSLVAQIKECYVPFRRDLAACDEHARKHCQSRP